jgi:FkbM family methyltransferase
VDTIFDIGMYDGADTAYYLELGCRVIAVEANPELVDHARRRFSAEIASGRLVCINAALAASDAEEVELHLSAADVGSSSLFENRIAHKQPRGIVSVPALTMENLLREHGVPKYMKVDIEGADRFCVLALTADARPAFLSFEMSGDLGELLAHAAAIGYKRFKIINQLSFRELSDVWCARDRIAVRLMNYMGYAEPRLVRRAGRFFVSGHSSGPVPWKTEGKWRDIFETSARLKSTKMSGWHDIHATT